MSNREFTRHIKIISQGASELGERFIKLRIKAKGASEAVTTIERIDNLSGRDVQARMFQRLNTLGAYLVIGVAKKELLGRLQDEGNLAPSFTVLTKVGWAAGAFVLPSAPKGVIGTPDQKIEVYLADMPQRMRDKYRVSGTLDGWKEIPKLARGNSRMILSLSLALVGPLGDILGVEQVGVQLCGEGGSGKSGIAIAAGSIWGLHQQKAEAVNHGFGETWNHTINNLEDVAFTHNHAILILDETRASDRAGGKSRVEMIADTAMRLSGSVAKGRLTNTGPQGSWWIPILSTSNRSLDKMAEEERRGATIDDAYRGRLIDVPLPLEKLAFEDLHGFSNKAEFTKRLIEVVLEHHGSAAGVFLKKLVRLRQRDEEELRASLQKRRNIYLGKARAGINGYGRDLTRFHEKFATIFAAGSLGIQFGLFPWTHTELGKALIACEQAHVDLVRDYVTTVSPLERLQDHIRQNQGSFVDLRKGPVSNPDHDHRACLGYLAEDRGKAQFWFSNQRFEEVAGGKDLAQTLKQSLHGQGYLKPTGGGKEGDRFASKRPVQAGKGRQYVIAIDASVLDA